MVLFLVTMFLDIVAEGLWWRGYLLPRQELVHGSLTWVVQGLLWTLFHAYKYWLFPPLLVACLISTLITQLRQNTCPVFVVGLIMNLTTIMAVLTIVNGN